MGAMAPLLTQEFRLVPPPRTHQGAALANPTGSSRPAVRVVPSTERFEAIVDEYQRRLYGFALRMTGNREDAEEIVQDAFVRAFRALGKMTEEQRAELRLQPWLYTITLNVTRNRLRSKRPTNVALDALADPDALLSGTQEGPDRPEAIVERGADMVLVEQALLQLPMHLRAAATLRFIEGHSHPGDRRNPQSADRDGQIARPPRRAHPAAHPRPASRSPRPPTGDPAHALL